jgi:hypothetical protein
LKSILPAGSDGKIQEILMDILVIAIAGSFFVGMILGKYIGRQEYHQELLRQQEQKQQMDMWQNYIKGGKNE